MTTFIKLLEYCLLVSNMNVNICYIVINFPLNKVMDLKGDVMYYFKMIVKIIVLRMMVGKELMFIPSSISYQNLLRRKIKIKIRSEDIIDLIKGKVILDLW